MSIADALFTAVGGNDEQSTVSAFLDTGYPPLNFALSSRWDGGMPVGRMVEVFGPPSAGKTAVATQCMISAQRQGGFAIFMDHEHSFDLDLAVKLGLDPDPNKFLYKKPRTFEASLDNVVKIAKLLRGDNKGGKVLLAKDKPICVIFDSLASMIPQSKLTDAKGEDRDAASYNMHDNTALARATSAAIPALSQYADELGVCCIFLNQERMKPGVMYGNPVTTPGGESPKFYASIRVQLGGQMIAKGTGSAKEILGKEITARVVKNKISRPFLSAKWRFIFTEDGKGKFDAVRSLVDFLVEEGILKSHGAYVEWIDGKKYHREPLAEHIETAGLHSDLIALLPKQYEPEPALELTADAE